MAYGRQSIERMRLVVGEIQLRRFTRCAMFGFATSVDANSRSVSEIQYFQAEFAQVRVFRFP